MKIILNILNYVHFVKLLLYLELSSIYGNNKVLHLHLERLLYKQNSIKFFYNVISVVPVFTAVKLPDFSIILTI